MLPEGGKIRLADTSQLGDIRGMTASRADGCSYSVEFGGQVGSAPPLAPFRDSLAKVRQPHPRQIVSLRVEKRVPQISNSRRPIGAAIRQVQNVDDEDAQQTTGVLVRRRR